MRKLICSLLVTMTAALGLHAQEIEVVEMKPINGIELSNFHFVKLSPNPAGVLVLIPGYNGSPEGLINNAQWHELAQKHQFDIVGCHFKGSARDSSQMYQFPQNGSGKLLLDAMKQVYKKDLPMALYGFSAGAQFSSRFVALHPRRVKVWAAYGAGSVDKVQQGRSLPPGVVACGKEDKTRYDGLLSFFEEGRKAGYPWIWVSVPDSGHKATPATIDFIRGYFDSVLSSPMQQQGVWIDLATGAEERNPGRKITYGWLPEATLIDSWKAATGK